LSTAARQQRAVEAGLGRERVQPLAGHALDALLHVEPRAGPVPVHLRNDDVRQRRQMGADALGIAAFVGQVELALERTRELAHELLRPVGLERGPFLLGHGGQPGHEAQVGVDDGFDARTADLHHHRRAVVQPRGVHLRDGSGGQRLGLELREDGFGFAAEVFAQLRAQRLKRQRGHLAVELLELDDPLRPEQVGPAGEDLPELDEGRPEFLQRQPHLHRRAQPRKIGRVLPVQRMARALEPLGQTQTAHQVTEAVAYQHPGDLLEAHPIARGEHGVDQHGAIIGDYRPLNTLFFIASPDRLAMGHNPKYLNRELPLGIRTEA
jgi:hypothetical protein